MSKSKLTSKIAKAFIKSVKKIKSIDFKKTFKEQGESFSSFDLVLKHKKKGAKGENKPKLSGSDLKAILKSSVKSKKKKNKSPEESIKKIKKEKPNSKETKKTPKKIVVKVKRKPEEPKAKVPLVSKTVISNPAPKPKVSEKVEKKAVQEKKTSPVAKTPVSKSQAPKVVKADNLKLVPGIGPKIESFLKEDGIDSFEKLAKADPLKIKAMLITKGGTRYNANDPTDWPKHAALLQTK